MAADGELRADRGTRTGDARERRESRQRRGNRDRGERGRGIGREVKV